MKNRTLHISGAFLDGKKANIELQKANIDLQKANIRGSFNRKTATNIIMLLDEYGVLVPFGRSDVEKTLNLKPTRCSALLKDMLAKGVIEPVRGMGKGKYHFKL